jgi:Mg-chelatase subunit ChlD
MRASAASASAAAAAVLALAAVAGVAGVAGAAPPRADRPVAGESIGGGKPARVDLVIAIDATGSMFDEVFVARATALAAVDAYARADPPIDLRVGVVTYRDKGDDPRVVPFELTSDLAAVRKFINAVDAKGGGDRRESVWFALQTAIRTLKWDLDKNTAKSLLVIGDAPSKTYKGEPDLVPLAAEAKAKRIVMSAIAISKADDTLAEFTRIAKLGGGSFATVEPPPPRTDVPRGKPPPGRDVVFVVDTTGSMSGSIAAVRTKVHALAKTMAAEGGGGDSALQEFGEVRFGLVDYRDRGDAWVAKMRTPLTSDMGRFLSEVDKLYADGGGDWPESVTKGLMVALDDKMGWGAGSGKAIVLVGDAEPHRYKGEPSYEDLARDAGARAIPINTVGCSGDSEVPPFKKIASLSGGEFYTLAKLGRAVDDSVGGK